VQAKIQRIYGRVIKVSISDGDQKDNWERAIENKNQIGEKYPMKQKSTDFCLFV